MATRIDSVDTVRLLAITGIIAIHSGPFRNHGFEATDEYQLGGVLFNQLARFAVPFFFIISGYFFGYKVRTGANHFDIASKTCKRIISLYLIWSLIYLLPYNVSSLFIDGSDGPFSLANQQFNLLLEEPSRIIFVGAKGHLWFLSSLILCTAIAAFLLRYRQTGLLIALAIGCYVVGVLAKAYEATPIGIELDFNTRNGPFFGLIYFVTGYLLSGVNNREKWFSYGLILLLVGGGLGLVESSYLHREYGASPYPDFVFATVIFGLGSALMSLSNHPLLCNRKLATIGQMTLGIYALHYMVIDLLKPLDIAFNHPLWEVGYVFVVLLMSIGASKLLLAFPRTKKLVA
ncbi:acyltransferase [Neiella marina]|uniref:Acyltransferase n=1 Tax=Neiella holothuriorum TaxID=2870530 RepID=A0ABS7EBB7_9GAMM|nr:acyltransferase [Neiella holothuriorum]MBW8189621.1 acyltransferase [Neiella holothuriorum]